MVFRFYNGTSMTLVEIAIKVIARYETHSEPISLINRRLKCLTADNLIADQAYWAYGTPGVPFTVRVPLSNSMSAQQVGRGSKIDLQGLIIDKTKVDIVVLATGIVAETGNSFASMARYSAAECFSVGHPEEVSVVDEERPIEWPGWEEFEESYDSYIFGYGSLVNPSSIAKTVGHEYHPFDGPFEADLKGWRRAWNVASDPSTHPKRTYIWPDGTIYRGTTVALGLEKGGLDDICSGAVYRVSEKDLSLLDRRESGYDRIEVGDLVTWPGKPNGVAVFTYYPKPENIHRLKLALNGGQAVVRQGYMELIETAFRDVSEHALRRYRETTPQPPCETAPLRIEDH
jgi:hypothetical protein